MSNHSNTRKRPAASGRRVSATRSNSSSSTQPAPRSRETAKHITHAAGTVGVAVALETAAKLICEHVLPVALPFLH